MGVDEGAQARKERREVRRDARHVLGVCRFQRPFEVVYGDPFRGGDFGGTDGEFFAFIGDVPG